MKRMNWKMMFVTIVASILSSCSGLNRTRDCCRSAESSAYDVVVSSAVENYKTNAAAFRAILDDTLMLGQIREIGFPQYERVSLGFFEDSNANSYSEIVNVKFNNQRLLEVLNRNRVSIATLKSIREKLMNVDCSVIDEIGNDSTGKRILRARLCYRVWNDFHLYYAISKKPIDSMQLDNIHTLFEKKWGTGGLIDNYTWWYLY